MHYRVLMLDENGEEVARREFRMEPTDIMAEREYWFCWHMAKEMFRDAMHRRGAWPPPGPFATYLDAVKAKRERALNGG
jgi:hypothetical protein